MRRAATVAVLAMLFAAPLHAQAPTPLLAPGDAVVTGFSGALPPVQIAPGVDPIGLTFIDAAGASLRVIDLDPMRGPPQGQLVAAPKPFAFTAAQLGQVFAVALDNAVPANIYAAASSAYGLHIARPGSDGNLVHARGAAPGNVFMPGMWGAAAPGGGPGSIWKIDGLTGAVTLFANVTLGGVANSGPALGGLAFDAHGNALYVADRETGMIHRFNAAGQETARYDHGVTGRAAQGLRPVAFDPARRLDITHAPFDASLPETWNYAAAERRVFGLGIHDGRLYYAVAANLEIWSVALTPEGFADPAFELSVPAGLAASEISKITFDDQGRMILAERPAPTGAQDFEALSPPGKGRVLRYAIAAAYPGAPRTWQALPDSYAIGLPAPFTNGNGGVAVGYDYDRTGHIDAGACGGFLWSTGERLRDRGNVTAIEQTGPPNVDGLQGNFIWSIRPANTPPLRSYFVDFDDRFDDPAARGHLGDIAIWRVCGPVLRGGWMLPDWFAWPEGGSPSPPPRLACPPGEQKDGVQCCPKGMSPDTSGACKPWCPNGKLDGFSENLCGLGFDSASYDPAHPDATKCIGGAAPIAGQGILGCALHSPLLNPPLCPLGYQKQQVPGVGELCKPGKAQASCPPGEQISPIDGKCHALCLGGLGWPVRQCCPAGAEIDPHTGVCRRLIAVCPKGSKNDPKTGKCVPPGGPCPAGSQVDPVTGACTHLVPLCPAGAVPDPKTGTCMKKPPPSCPAGQQSGDGACCKAGWSPNGKAGGCCPPGKAADGSGVCRRIGCFAPNTMVGGKCCAPDDLKPGGVCAVALCGVSRAPANGDVCCDADRIYAGKGGAALCCPSPLQSGQCAPVKGTPVNAKCAPGSTDPSCCPSGYTFAGGACCLASQLTSTGQCCPAGQVPSGANRAQCQPQLSVGIPPHGGEPPSLGTGGQCCAAGSIPLASGVCCEAAQATASGVCCPSGQRPDPATRGACVPAQSCGVRETLVADRCCPNANLYTDAQGRPQCCAAVVDPLKNTCPSPPSGVVPPPSSQCHAGYTAMPDGSCCADRYVRGAACAAPPLDHTLPVPPPVIAPLPPPGVREPPPRVPVEAVPPRPIRPLPPPVVARPLPGPPVLFRPRPRPFAPRLMGGPR